MTTTAPSSATGSSTGSSTGVLVRRSVWSLDATDPFGEVTAAYAHAVGVMQGRDADDPTSWSYQAAMHGTYADAVAGQNWNQCQHASWYFLPWHRLYVYFFERIVRRAVLDDGGPADWALPYWDYSVGGAAAGLPLAVRAPTLPDGTDNPLYTDQRAQAANDGARLPRRQTSAAMANSFTNFTGLPQACFGGGDSSPAQFSTVPGQLEIQPHNVVHNLLGGADGWMGDPNQAAQDPVFWLHHANIDRLWSNWLALAGGRANPTDPAWQTAVFRFFDADGTEVERTPADALDPATQLGYRYDDSPPPVAVTLRRRLASAGPAVSGPSGPPRLLAASEAGASLGPGRTTVDVPVSGSAGRRLAEIADDPADRGRILLTVDDILAERSPGVVFEVHLNLPDDADPATDDSFLVGQLTFFGTTMTDAGGEPRGAGGAGMSHSYDITGLVEQLRALGRWDPSTITVSFVPVGLSPPPGQPGTAHDVAPASAPTIGRVSIHTA